MSNNLGKIVKEDRQEVLVELDSAKNYIVKSNNLIQKSKFELTNKEQKIILSLIQQIRPTDTELYPVAFKISTFCKLSGINTSGKNFNDFREAIQTLADRSMWMFYDNGEGEKYMTLARWIDDPIINPKTQEVYLKLNDKLKPELLNLTQNFTKYNYQYTLPMKCVYSARIYEILKSYAYRCTKECSKIKINLNDLRELLTEAKDVKKKKFIYPRFIDLKRFVLEPTIEEINKFTDLDVSIDFEKTGRSFTDVIFDIRLKKMPAQLEIKKNVLNALNRNNKKDFDESYGRQLSFEEYSKIKNVAEIIKSNAINNNESILLE